MIKSEITKSNSTDIALETIKEGIVSNTVQVSSVYNKLTNSTERMENLMKTQISSSTERMENLMKIQITSASERMENLMKEISND